jgi:hypothetical protein
MFRAVLSILLALPMLVPHGMCLREFTLAGCLAPTKGSTHAQDGNAQQTGKRHAGNCGCGHRERVERVCEAEDSCQTASDSSALTTDAPSCPRDQPEPCSPAVCKAKLDKMVPHDDPQAGWEVASFGFVLATPPHARLPVHSHTVATFTSPPLYITFCSFLI